MLTASSASESDRDSTSSSMTAVMERSLSGIMHSNGMGLGNGAGVGISIGAGNGSGAGAGGGPTQHLILHHSSTSGSPVGNLALDASNHLHHQQLMGKQLNSPHHLLHPMHMSTSPSSLPSSSASSIASSTSSTSPGLLLSSVLPMKKVGRRGRPPKKDAKSRNRQGLYLLIMRGEQSLSWSCSTVHVRVHEQSSASASTRERNSLRPFAEQKRPARKKGK